MEFLAGDRIFTGRPGDAVYIPHTTRHHVKNVGIQPARVLFFYTPGGPEGLFVEAGEEPVPGVQVQPRSPEQAGDRLSLLIDDYGTQMLPEQ